jgi:TubC N-terminal docking domain
MSAATDLLEELSRRGVAAQADGETIRLKPRTLVDDDLLARVRAHKPEIVAVLSGRTDFCALTCYEIEPGCRIHHPWDGCKTCITPLPNNLPRKAQVACWHCTGSGKCACVSCGRFEPRAAWSPGRCKPCEVRGRERVQ